MADAYEIALLIGRLLFGGFFVMMGVNHLTNRAAITEYASSQGLPAPGLAVVASGLLILLGGTLVLLGLYPLVGLAAIALFLLVVSPTMHAFWTVEDPQQRMAEQTQFLKNVALLGAALALMAVSTPWGLALTL